MLGLNKSESGIHQLELRNYSMAYSNLVSCSYFQEEACNKLG